MQSIVNFKIRGCLSKLIVLSIIFNILLGSILPQTLYASDSTITNLNRKIKILEITDTGKTDLVKLEKSKYNVETVSMKKFVALRDELNGKYDVIYIGSGTYSTSGVSYNQNNHNERERANNTKNVMNDITNLKANEIKEDFIKKGQIVILHTDIFKQNKSKLKTNFEQYRNNSMPNVVIINNVSDVGKTLNREDIKRVIAKRPIIDDAVFEHSYTKLDGERSGIENTITVKYRLLEGTEFNSNKLYAKLYLDENSNKKYENEELIISQLITGGEGTLTYKLPAGYAGLRFFKFEIKDEFADYKDYIENTVILKGEKVRINVLQVTKGDTPRYGMEASNLNRFLTGRLGGENRDYEIKIDVVDIKTFNSVEYGRINGKYDMLIFGFADEYNRAGISLEAAKAVKEFIKTGQSVMFTHDTIFEAGNNWVSSFMDETGQKAPLHNLGYGAPRQSKATKKVNNGLITRYPFELGDSIQIATTHSQYYTLDLEDPTVVPWYNIIGGERDEDDSWNHYYTYSKGTVTYSGTGHTNNDYGNNPQEMDLFVNTMYTAFFGANHAPTIELLKPVLTKESNNITINSTDIIDLKYIVNDLDLRDDSLNTKIYTKVAGNIEEIINRDVKRGTTIEQALNNPMPLGGEFTIIIEATDKMGARAEKTIQVASKPPMSSNLQVSRKFNPDKVELGQKTNIEYEITFPELSNNPSKKIENITLTNKIPKGLKVNKEKLPEGWLCEGSIDDGYTLTADIPSIAYKSNGKNYIAEPIKHEVEVVPTDNGEYRLEGGQISFDDLDSKTKEVLLNQAVLTVETRVKKVELDKHQMVVKKGESSPLTVKVLPENASNKDVEWVSSDSNIADIYIKPGTNGWEVDIRGHKVGTATITVISSDNKQITDTCIVSVTNPVESISIKPDKAELSVAQTLELEVIFNPSDAVNKNVTWSTSNLDIVSIEAVEGEKIVVLARSQGLAVITATTEGGLEASSEITVRPLLDPPDVTKPTIAGYGYVHPLSLGSINMTMKAKNELNNARLTMTIPDIGILFTSSSDVTAKINGTKLSSSDYRVTNNIVTGDTISIDLGTLTPGDYNIEIYANMNPSSTLVDINNYNAKVSNNEVITVSNKLKAGININGSVRQIDFDLENYELKLIKIPTIN